MGDDMPNAPRFENYPPSKMPRPYSSIRLIKHLLMDKDKRAKVIPILRRYKIKIIDY